MATMAITLKLKHQKSFLPNWCLARILGSNLCLDTRFSIFVHEYFHQFLSRHLLFSHLISIWTCFGRPSLFKHVLFLLLVLLYTYSTDHSVVCTYTISLCMFFFSHHSLFTRANFSKQRYSQQCLSTHLCFYS